MAPKSSFRPSNLEPVTFIVYYDQHSIGDFARSEQTNRVSLEQLRADIPQPGQATSEKLELVQRRYLKWFDETPQAQEGRCTDCGAPGSWPHAIGWVRLRELEENDQHGSNVKWVVEFVTVPYCSRDAKCFQVAVFRCRSKVSMFLPGGIAKVAVRVGVPLPLVGLDPYAPDVVSKLPSISDIPIEYKDHELEISTMLLQLYEDRDDDLLITNFTRIAESLRSPLLQSKLAWNCIICGEEAHTSNGICHVHTDFNGLVHGQPGVKVAHLTSFFCSDLRKPCHKLLMTMIMNKKRATPGPFHQRCGGCLTYTTDPKKEFKRCAQCKGPAYCSKECQRKHWPAHKKVCEEMAAQRFQLT